MSTANKVLALISAVLMIASGIGYWRANTALDRCNAEVQARSDRVQAKIDKNQTLVDELTRLRNAGRAAQPQ